MDKAASLPGDVFDLLDNIKFLAQDGKKNADLVTNMQLTLQKQRKWQNLTIIMLIGIIIALVINRF